MTGTLTRTVSRSEQAFMAVMDVSREYAQQVENAQISGDTIAESMAKLFGMAAMMDAIAKHPEAVDVITRAGGHKWGFRTDDDTVGKGTNYSKDILIACFCDAGLQKLKAVGNEFNIISSEVYVTREGWEGKLERLPGVTEVDIIPGAITEYDEKEYTTKIKTTREGKQYGGEQKTKLVAYVSATASCKVWGDHVEVRAWRYPDGRDERLQLTGTADIVEAMIDQLKGKASARIAEQLFKKCVGMSRRGPQNAEPEIVRQVIQCVPKQPVQDAIVVEQPQEKNPVQTDWRQVLDMVLTRIDDAGERDGFKILWTAVADCASSDGLAEIGNEIKAAKSLYSERDLAELRRFFSFRKGCL